MFHQEFGDTGIPGRGGPAPNSRQCAAWPFADSEQPASAGFPIRPGFLFRGGRFARTDLNAVSNRPSGGQSSYHQEWRHRNRGSFQSWTRSEIITRSFHLEADCGVVLHGGMIPKFARRAPGVRKSQRLVLRECGRGSRAPPRCPAQAIRSG